MRPVAVVLTDGQGGVKVVHGIEDRGTFIAHRYTYVLAEHAVHADAEFQLVLQYLGADQRAEVGTVHLRTGHYPFALGDVDRCHVGGLLATAVDGEVVVVAQGCLHHFVLPVGAAAAVVHVVDVVLLHVATDILGRSHVEGLQGLVEGHIAGVVHIDALLVLLAFLGGHDDHTVGGLRTVDGGSRGIAQHVDAFDIVGCHHRDVHAGNTVDDIVGAHGTGTQGGGTTQGHAGRAVRVAAGRYRQTGHLSLQHTAGIGEYTLVQLVCLYGGNRRGHILAAHRTVTDDNDFFQCLRVIFEHHVQGGAVHHSFQCLVTNIGEDQGLAFRYVHDKFTVDIRNHTVGSTLFEHVDTD